MKISVCMASFDGSDYIYEQVQSILIQLDFSDELIIVDDCSTDNTYTILQNISDLRIKLYRNIKNEGVARTFSNALLYATGDIIFMSDQDDLWLNNKKSTVLSYFNNFKVDIVVHNAHIMLDNEVIPQTLFDLSSSSSGFLKNIYKNTFTGCCIAFRRSFITHFIPINIPRSISCYHDAWIGAVSHIYGFKVKFANECLIIYRRHFNNASSITGRKSLVSIKERCIFIFCLFKFVLKKYFTSL